MRFCSRLTASGDDRFAFSIADGNALTFHFEGVAAEVEAVKSPDLVAAHVFSAIVPLEVGDNGGENRSDNRADISFQTQGYAFANEGSSGYAVLSVNGKTSVEHFPAGTDREMEQYFTVEAGPADECHLTIVTIAQRDPAFPDGIASIRFTSVDALIKPRS
jgi:hypothetical protein